MSGDSPDKPGPEQPAVVASRLTTKYLHVEEPIHQEIAQGDAQSYTWTRYACFLEEVGKGLPTTMSPLDAARFFRALKASYAGDFTRLQGILRTEGQKYLTHTENQEQRDLGLSLLHLADII